MRKKLYVLVLFFIVSGFLHAQVDILSAEINFEFVSKNVNGTIADFKSDSSIDPDNIENSVLSGSVAVESIKTGNFIRDWSLKGSKYFDEEEFPTISFRSEKVVRGPNEILVSGTLTLKGKSRPFDIHFVQKGNQLLGKALLYSSDYGIHIKYDREDNLVKVEMNLILAE